MARVKTVVVSKLEFDALIEENKRLQEEHDAAMKAVDEAEDKHLDLIEENERLRVDHATLRRVEKTKKIMEDTRFATPPMDASECVVLLNQALEGGEE